MTERSPRGIRRWWKRIGELWPAIVAQERWERGMYAAGFRSFHENPFHASYVARGIVREPVGLDWTSENEETYDRARQSSQSA